MNLSRLHRRRLTDGERRPMFALISSALVGLALLSLLLLPEQPAGERPRVGQTVHQPNPAHPARRAPVVDRAAVAADARAFVTGYLNYLAGADAQTIPRVSFALRRLLARHRPPRGHGEHRRERLLDVQLGTVTDDRAPATATVVDGTGATFPIHLRLSRVSDGWEVSSLGR